MQKLRIIILWICKQVILFIFQKEQKYKMYKFLPGKVQKLYFVKLINTQNDTVESLRTSNTAKVRALLIIMANNVKQKYIGYNAKA